MEFRLVDGKGNAVSWDKNVVYYNHQDLTGPAFKTDVPPGTTLFAGMYLLRNAGDGVTPLAPEVRREGGQLTVNVEAIDRSLRSCRALAWSNGRLYVAEQASNDGGNRYVHVFDRAGERVARLATVSRPRALAVSDTTLYVLGDHELAAFRLKGHAKVFARPVDYARDVAQMAVLGGRLYVGDKGIRDVRVLDADNGSEVGRLFKGAEKLTTEAGLGGVGVAATPAGNLIVSDATRVREFSPDGRLRRVVKEVKGGQQVAVGPRGDVALLVPYAKDADYGYTPEVWTFDPRGEPLLRLVRVYVSGPRTDPKYPLRYFGGLHGHCLIPGGIAVDDDGKLYVSESLDWARSETELSGAYLRHMDKDGGVIRFSASGDCEARLGSRFSGGSFARARLAERAGRPPLRQTAAAFAGGKRLSLLAWGDSIAQCAPKADFNGGASTFENNWVRVLGRLIEKRHPGLRVRAVADGVGGQNAAEGLCRDPVPWQGPQPDLILLEFGTNDAVFHYQSPAQYARALREMVRALFVLTDSDVVLLTPGPLLGKTLREPEADYVRAAEEVGKEMNVPVVNMAAAVTGRLKAEKLTIEKLHRSATDVHPNDAGHQVWAEAVLGVLTKEAEKSAK